MLVAVMSDSHDNIWNLRKAVKIVRDRQAGLLVHCGDFIAPFMLKELDCFGHTHEHEIRQMGHVTLLNPGEIMGKEGSPGFCFVDTQTAGIERVEI
jgi:predicted phosphodiesterase